MSQELYSAEQVAERLGLHVRTVRGYIREGRLPAVRIGKQYRIAHADLERLTGRPLATEQAAGDQHVEVSSIVQIEAVDQQTADRIVTALLASVAGHGLRIETMYDLQRARLKVVVLGDLAGSADVLRLIDALVGAAR